MSRKRLSSPGTQFCHSYFQNGRNVTNIVFSCSLHPFFHAKSRQTKMQTTGVWCIPLGRFKPLPVNGFHKIGTNPVFSYISEIKEHSLSHPKSDFSESLLTYYSESWTPPRSPGRTLWNLVCGQVKIMFLSIFLFLCWLSHCSCYWLIFLCI